MPSDIRAEDLGAAVTAGLLSPSQAAALSAFVEARRKANPADAFLTDDDADAGAENIHFARGFHDIFMTIGVAMLLPGIVLAGPMTGLPLLGSGLALIAAWALAEFLTGRRRLVLPSIALVIAVALLAGMFTSGASKLIFGNGGLALIVGTVGGLAAALAFYLRFRLPFALAVLAAAVIAMFFAVLAYVLPVFTAAHLPLLALVAGLCAFTAAMSQDLSDPKRRTLRADNAFWLHLLAAPLIVHALIGMLIGDNARDLQGIGDAGVVIAIVAALGIIAILIDRRAMLVSGLAYVGFALARLVRETDISALGVTALTLVILGAAVVALGSGWRPVRNALLRLVPRSFASLLPPAGM
ncbi:MAG TPA: hypothetical protein VGN05_06850 [Parvibaculum sp.]|jgi:hypothetical protein